MEALVDFLHTAATKPLPNTALRNVGCIVHGPPGSGKTTILRRALAEKFDIAKDCQFVSCPDLFASGLGATEAALETVFIKALRRGESKQAGSIAAVVVLDHVHAIAHKQAKGVELRVQATLKRMLQLCHSNKCPVITIGVTSEFALVDAGVLGWGRLNHVIVVPPPNVSQRREILQNLVKSSIDHIPASEIESVAQATVGFTPADLTRLCSEALLQRIRQSKSTTTHTNDTNDTNDANTATQQNVLTQPEDAQHTSKEILLRSGDLLLGLCQCRPSLVSDEAPPQTTIPFDEISGLDDAVADLRITVQIALSDVSTNQSRFRSKGGVLLHGPAACGKSLLVHSLAAATHANFIEVQPSRVLSKFVGESEQKLAKIFHKARTCAPCILFFDNIDLIGGVRDSHHSAGHALDRVLSLLLVELDGVFSERAGHPPLIVIGATRDLSRCDPAILRAGRFDHHIHVSPPSNEGRKAILQQLLRHTPTTEDVDVSTLANKTQGKTGADLCWLCREAALCALRQNINNDKVCMQHFEHVLLQQNSTHIRN